MSEGTPFFSVFTPTFNRAHTLERVYRSLLTQTDRDFEWIVVDDGSIDGTEELVRRWLEEGRLTIRYFFQPNSGKHVAFNRGVREARGELFLPLDSDDTCLPQALECFRSYWMSIPAGKRGGYSGVTGLCINESGRVVGGELPQPIIDGRSFAVMSRLGRNDEMWGCVRTDVLRRFPFPEFPGEWFVPESLVWNRIGLLYLTRFVSEPLRVYHQSADSLTASAARNRAGSPSATLSYYGEILELPVRLGVRLRAAANLWRFAIEADRLAEIERLMEAHPLLLAAGYVPGRLLAWRDGYRLRGEARKGS